MSQFRFISLRLLAAAAFLTSGAAFAHPKVVLSTPADHADVSAPGTIEVSFSEALMTQLSGADLMMTEMPGMTMDPVKIAVKTAASSDAKSLVITPTRPLSSGTYRVDWHVVSSDTHAAKGSFSFHVK